MTINTLDECSAYATDTSEPDRWQNEVKTGRASHKEQRAVEVSSLRTKPHSSHEHDLPTRHSLLCRLQDLGDNESWRVFFETYWRLIYNVARRSGLNDDAAQEVVQETVIAVARKIPSFRYDPEKGSFKSWLLLICRRRIQDHLRRVYSSRDLLSQEN